LPVGIGHYSAFSEDNWEFCECWPGYRALAAENQALRRFPESPEEHGTGGSAGRINTGFMAAPGFV
jgi:hypothetical protein